MNRGQARSSLLLWFPLAAAACTSTPTASLAEGPSRFLTGFQLRTVAASVNETPDGPRCLEIPPNLPMIQTTDASERWSEARMTTSCEDPGDGTALAQAWAAGVDSELSRLDADVVGKSESTTVTGETFTDGWTYSSSGLRGHISVEVLPAPEGRYWLTLRISEAS